MLSAKLSADKILTNAILHQKHINRVGKVAFSYHKLMQIFFFAQERKKKIDRLMRKNKNAKYHNNKVQ